MKRLLVGLLALGTISAQASMLEINGPLDVNFFEAEVDQGQTYFETLGDMFKKGTRPNPTKISNIAWAGRCFTFSAQNNPANAGYIFRQKINDAGPIAASSKAYEAFSYWALDKEPNFFDKMDLEQVFAFYKTRTSAPFRALDARIKTDSIEINLDSSKSNLKVSGDYLVEEISGVSGGDVGPVGKVTVGVRCYYFIPDLNG